MNSKIQQLTARVLLAVAIMGMTGSIGYALLKLPTNGDGLTSHVNKHLEQSGVKHDVTAVLLNFRGYDTMLEIAVLFLAALGARALVSETESFRVTGSANPVLTGFVRIVAPTMIVVAGYMLWVGGHAPGGAFQAGAILAALGVLLLLAGLDWTVYISPRVERWLLVFGLIVFLVVGVGVMSDDRALLQYPPTIAKWLILVIEAACTISIAVILVVLFVGGRMNSGSECPTTGNGAGKGAGE